MVSAVNNITNIQKCQSLNNVLLGPLKAIENLKMPLFGHDSDICLTENSLSYYITICNSQWGSLN